MAQELNDRASGGFFLLSRCPPAPNSIVLKTTRREVTICMVSVFPNKCHREKQCEARGTFGGCEGDVSRSGALNPSSLDPGARLVRAHQPGRVGGGGRQWIRQHREVSAFMEETTPVFLLEPRASRPRRPGGLCGLAGADWTRRVCA